MMRATEYSLEGTVCTREPAMQGRQDLPERSASGDVHCRLFLLLLSLRCLSQPPSRIDRTGESIWKLSLHATQVTTRAGSIIMEYT